MKKNLLLLTISALCAMGAVAQKDSTRHILFGAEIGPNLTGGIFLKNPGSSPKGSPGVGYQLGILAELPLGHSSWSLRPNLQFSRESITNKVYGEDFPIHVSMLKLPIDFIYHPSPANNPWFFGAGPYFAMGVGGNFEFNGFKTKIDFGSNSDNDVAKRFDVGLDLLAGYRLTDKITLSADLNFGFVNVMNDNYWGPGVSGHSLNFGISGAYMFGPK